MTYLSQLPNELLLLVVEYLSDQRDIAALLRVNWMLYRRLHTFLCQFNIRHHQSAGLLPAAKNGQSSLVQKFLDLGASIASLESQSDDAIHYHYYETWCNPLLLAAQNDHVETLEILLSENRPSRMYVPSQLRTVLDWAIGAGKQAIVELMIAHKAPLGPLDDKHNSTPLSRAVEKGCEAIVECLLKAGAKPPSTYCLDDPLTMATHEKSDILLRLLKHGLRPKSEEVLCHIAIRNDIASLQTLIQFGVEIAVYGHAALFTAILWGRRAMVEFLIQQGANPHLRLAQSSGIHYSAIGHAILRHQSHIVKLLLAYGVRPDHQDLQLAIKMEVLEVVSALEHLSYEDVPEKLTLEDCVRQREDKRLMDPDFQPMEWGQYVGLGSPTLGEYDTYHELSVFYMDDGCDDDVPRLGDFLGDEDWYDSDPPRSSE